VTFIKHRYLGPLWGLLLAVSLPACDRQPDLSPPQLAYGQVECNNCRMIVSEERFAAAAVVVAGDEVRKLAFDDIGCLLTYLQAPPHDAQVIPYVHDYETTKWIKAADAVFLRSEKLRTPMASHLVACVSEGAARQLLTQYPGEIVAFADLRE
jgi:nitrous oxide reductase accessory protein NosL